MAVTQNKLLKELMCGIMHNFGSHNGSRPNVAIPFGK